MKVSELSGALLDYWVGCANNGKGFIGRIAEYTDGKRHCVVPDGVRGESGWTGSRIYAPSSDWAIGGHFIERQGIYILNYFAHPKPDTELVWTAEIRGSESYAGPTPLVAAMRAFVGSKFGEEVPDEVPA